jgi:putative DNA primase/helicase
MAKKTSNGSILLPVPAFNPDLLPDALRPWVVDIGERMQCPLDFPAVAAMVAIAGVVGRQVAIRPKQPGCLVSRV